MSEGFDYQISSDKFQVILSNDLYYVEQERKVQYFDITLQSDNTSGRQNIILNSYYYDDHILRFGESNPIDLQMKSNSAIYGFGEYVSISISKCSGNMLRQNGFRCATQDEVNELISEGNFVAAILIQQKVNIQQGLFTQTNKQYKQIYQLDYQNINLLTDNLKNPPETYVEFDIYLDNQVRYVQIEYTKLPQIWAQVWALASLLYLSRHIFLHLSLAYLAYDFLSVQLKYYYKKTAMRLSKENDLQKQSDSYHNNHQKAEFIEQQNEDIKNNKNYFRISKYQKWKTFLLPKICLKKKKRNNENQKILNLLKKQTNKDLCFFEQQKEFLRLKIAIKLLLTPEQYAAIPMCGCDLLNDQQKLNLEQIQNSQQKDNQINYIHEISVKNSDLSSSDIYTPINSYQIENYVAQPSSQEVQNHLELMEKVDIDSEYRKSCLEKFLSENEQINEGEQVLINKRINTQLYDRYLK
ncbi:hypothetical protein ABPG72_019308 [Tetrahymena utriculariae]